MSIRELSLKAKIIAVTAIPVFLISIMGGICIMSFRAMTNTSKWVHHTHIVQEHARLIISSAVDMETGERGFLITGKEEFLEPYENGEETAFLNFKALIKRVDDNPNQVKRLQKAESLLMDWQRDIAEPYIALRREVGTTKTMDDIVAMVGQAKGKSGFDEFRRIMADFIAEEEELLGIRQEESAKTANQTMSMIAFTMVLVVVAFAVGISLAIITSKSVTEPLEKASLAAESMAGGDMTIVVEEAGQNEIRILTNSINRMAGNLRGQISDLNEGANTLSTSVNQIAATISQVSSGANESATAVAQIMATVDELRQTADLNSQKAEQVSKDAKKSVKVSEQGLLATSQFDEKIRGISLQMESIAESVINLSEQTQAIGEIISAVDDLAEQSNILSVNASIEASKAGEQGKGFAVVAQEIKNLAEQSKEATKRVRTILAAIQKATGSTVMATEQGSKAVDESSIQAQNAKESIQRLAESVVQAEQAALQIAASSRQQQVGIEQVSAGIGNINEASSQNVVSMSQLGGESEKIKELGHKLLGLVNRYKV